MKVKWLSMVVLTTLVVLLTGAFSPASQQVTVTFWHTYSDIEAEFLRTVVIPDFEILYPDIKIEEVKLPYDGFREKILTAVAAGEPPDVARVDIIWVPEFARAGYLSKLDELMPDFNAYKERMFPGPLATNFWKGHYYGLPLNTNTRVLVWNKEMYDAAGIAGPPKTISEFETVCDQLKAFNPNWYCFVDGGTYGWAVMPWIWSFGGDITDPDMTRATGYLNGPKTVAAYQFLLDLFQKGHISPIIIGEAAIGAWEGFVANVYANMLEGPWVGPLFKAMFPEKELHYSLMPAGEGGPISVVGGENIVLFEGSRNKEAAVTFIRFMLSRSVQVAMADPGLITVFADLAPTVVTGNPYLGIFMEQLKTAKPRLVHPAWAKIEEILTAAGQDILRGVKTPQQALNEAAQKVDALLP